MNYPASADAATGRFDDGIPAGRWGSPQDVAHAVLPLLSAAAGWTPVAVLHVDGGYTGV